MIHWKPELIAFYEKYKDVETVEEWTLLAKEVGKFDDPAILHLVLRMLEKIEDRYYQKKHGKAV